MNRETRPHSPDFEWSDAPKRDLFIATALPVLLLLPFLNKAFHIDDLVYIYVAQHILDAPFDPYGFELLGTWMHDITKNPPGHSYYLSVFGFIFGWSEPAMHFAMLFPTAFASLGIYFLARRLCGHPLFATCLCVLTPGFLVSASNVMCEPLMLTCYTWSIVFWMRGLDEERWGWLVLGTVVLCLGILTKFIVVTALPLMAAYTILRERRLSPKLVLIVGVPVLLLLVYDATMYTLYEKSTFLEAVSYSTAYSLSSTSRLSLDSVFIGMTFVGGCALPVVFAVLARLKRFESGAFALVAVCVGTVTIMVGGFDPLYTLYERGGIRWNFFAQTVVFGSAGVLLLAFTALDLARRRDPDSVLLALLVFGIFLFSVGINWTVNARSILPMIPALTIIALRHMEQKDTAALPNLITSTSVVFGVILTSLVNYGDYRHSGDARIAADMVTNLDGAEPGAVWFDGKSGFRYYMTQKGFRPVVFMPSASTWSDLGIESDDLIVVYESQRSLSVADRFVASEEQVIVGRNTLVATLNTQLGAGFYDGHQGPLPYYFGLIPKESCTIYTAR